MMLEKTRSRNDIKRCKTRLIASKSKFKGCDNETKTYKAKYTPEQVKTCAEKCRAHRLHNRTAAESTFEQLLKDCGIAFEAERLFYYAKGTRFIIIDFVICRTNILIELDGGIHRTQQKYDKARDAYLEGIGYVVMRLRNKEVLKEPAAIATRLRKEIDLQSTTKL